MHRKHDRVSCSRVQWQTGCTRDILVMNVVSEADSSMSESNHGAMSQSNKGAMSQSNHAGDVCDAVLVQCPTQSCAGLSDDIGQPHLDEQTLPDSVLTSSNQVLAETVGSVNHVVSHAVSADAATTVNEVVAEAETNLKHAGQSEVSSSQTYAVSDSVCRK